MTPPKIDKLKNTGAELVATIDGKEYPLTTFRESLARQAKVLLPTELWDRCEPLVIQADWRDETSEMMNIGGCIHDREVANWMLEFAAGKLKKGTLR